LSLISPLLAGAFCSRGHTRQRQTQTNLLPVLLSTEKKYKSYDRGGGCHPPYICFSKPSVQTTVYRRQSLMYAIAVGYKTNKVAKLKVTFQVYIFRKK